MERTEKLILKSLIKLDAVIATPDHPHREDNYKWMIIQLEGLTKMYKDKAKEGR